jgi:hypothetical protein
MVMSGPLLSFAGPSDEATEHVNANTAKLGIIALVISNAG